MADRFTGLEVNPYAWGVVYGWVGDEEELVTGRELVDVVSAIAKDGPVDGGPEAVGVFGRQGRR